MTAKQTKITFQAMTGKGTRAMDGYTFSDLPGIVIHRQIKATPDDGPVSCYTRGWIVTHLKSGKTLHASSDFYLLTLRSARAYAGELVKCADWTSSDPLADLRHISAAIGNMLRMAREAAEAAGG